MDPKLSLPEVVCDEALGNLSSLDSNNLAPSNWGKMTGVEKDAELDSILGESDGKQAATTQREPKAMAKSYGCRQTTADQRELAALREDNSQNDAGRTSGETESRVSQPSADPNSKRKTGIRRRWVM